ncbi:hypothetical protein MAPG_07933 [Magnaporthiopsis poae ATCC 64411]|uniref:Uncharacterized protein n=1 Tax=Magnaporthiopsis poae (strain ATCC 64411 / 73-15) TaxID=644358 RepID=A0A0C4E604_MAGP6|nr:hypothetical protein MAPG_07933 [Magnaporthiopsis poae ATCC 64411]
MGGAGKKKRPGSCHFLLPTPTHGQLKTAASKRGIDKGGGTREGVNSTGAAGAANVVATNSGLKFAISVKRKEKKKVRWTHATEFDHDDDLPISFRPQQPRAGLLLL